MPRDGRHEGRLLAAALTTLTRCPVPAAWLGPEPLPPDGLARSAKAFPAIGALVGAVSGLALAAAALLWPDPIPALVALGAGLLATGALHEDGLADTADGLGGRTRAARLAIMKDPGLGTFGALALGLVLVLKVAALAALTPAVAVAALVAAGGVSRLAPVLVMATTGYAGDLATAKFAHGPAQPSPGETATAAILAAIALVPLAVLDPLGAALGLLGSGLLAGPAVVRTCRSLGGHTGDVLGASVALAECGFLLGVAAGWR